MSLCRPCLLLLMILTSGTQAVLADPSSDPDAIITAEMAPLRDALLPLIRAAQADDQVPGLSLALVRNDRILWLEGLGFADPEQQRPARARTRYRVGSLAKPITALLVLAQQAEGRIDIDHPWVLHCPAFVLNNALIRQRSQLPRVICSAITLGCHPTVTKGFGLTNRSPRCARSSTTSTPLSRPI